MRPTRRTVLGLVAGGLLLPSCTTKADHSPKYISSPEPLDTVDRARIRAAASGKRLVIALGGNWCHDSKSLADRVHKGAATPALVGFDVELMSVGFLDEAREVARAYGDVPIYLHTPTVLIIDTQTGALMNAGDHRQFRDAAKLTDAEVFAYFEKYAPGRPAAPRPPSEGPPTYAAQYARVAVMVARQTTRLERAYDLIGPKLSARTADLNAHWDPVRDLRYQLADDIDRLRAELLAGIGDPDAAYTPVPVYPPFPWEGDAAS